MRKNKYIAVFILALVSMACNKEPGASDMPDGRLNFVYHRTVYPYGQYAAEEVTDEMRMTSYSFKYSADDVVADTVWFEVATMGNLSADADRPFALEQFVAEDVENAVAGIHYVAFDDESLKEFYKIPRGANTVTVPVIVLRKDSRLREKTVVLKFGFRDNGIFRLGYEGLTVRSLSITDRLAVPANWGRIAGLIGEYGERKHTLMIQWATDENQKWDEAYIDEFADGDSAYRSYMQQWLQRKLEEVNARLAETQQGPEHEEDGTPVSFIPKK